MKLVTIKPIFLLPTVLTCLALPGPQDGLQRMSMHAAGVSRAVSCSGPRLASAEASNVQVLRRFLYQAEASKE